LKNEVSIWYSRGIVDLWIGFVEWVFE